MKNAMPTMKPTVSAIRVSKSLESIWSPSFLCEGFFDEAVSLGFCGWSAGTPEPFEQRELLEGW